MRKARLGLEGIEREAERLQTLLPGEWELIQSTTLTGSVASVTFSSIPNHYRVLALFARLRTDRAGAAGDSVLWRANGDTGNNYDYVYLYGTGAGVMAAVSGIATTFVLLSWVGGALSRANNFYPVLCFWPGYSVLYREKHSLTVLTANTSNLVAANMILGQIGGHWRNTNAITSLTIFPNIGPNLVANSRLHLYGIL